METSILICTKKILGLAPEYTAFDLDIITHINTAFAMLAQLGIGPTQGFAITDDTAQWEDVIIDDIQLEAIKTFVYLRVRLLFDPPTTSYLIAAFEKQLDELAWRLNVHREETRWVDPNPVPGDEETSSLGTLDGGII